MAELFGSVDALLATLGPYVREPFAKTADSLSGSPFEWVRAGGRDYVLKHIGHDLDWLMRALDDGVDGRPAYAAVCWREGLLDGLPATIDTTVVGMAHESGAHGSGRTAVLMRDVTPALVPGGSTAIPYEQHRAFLGHMAQMHARYWGFVDTYGLLAPGVRYTALTPAMSAREAAAGHDDPVPRYVPTGWAALRLAEPKLHDRLLALATDPAPLVTALAATPRTLVHGDWKYGNLGSTVDGRTVLLDWAWVGADGPCVDLGWYLAVNCDRLPESKEDTIAAYRAALHAHGVDTAGWWEPQLDAALLGALVQLGWSKSGPELAWWARRVGRVAEELCS